MVHVDVQMRKCTSGLFVAGLNFEEREAVQLVEELCIDGNLDENRTGAWTRS